MATATTVKLTDKESILAALVAGQIDVDTASKLIGELQPAAAPRALACKVSEKGGLSVYGLNSKFPITLYVEQWERLLDYADSIRAFIKANSSKFTRKADKAKAA